MSTITASDKRKISLFLKDRHIPYGLGSKEEACSIAAINLALTGELTDRIPECMSPVVGRWIIIVQDAMPDEIRNSPEWRKLLPQAAGTGRDLEKQRLAIILDWMWGTVLPSLQAIADQRGFGAAWTTMTTKRTQKAAAAAAAAAKAAKAEAEAAAAAAAWAAEAAGAAAAAEAAAAWAAAAAAAWAAGAAAAAAKAAWAAAAAAWAAAAAAKAAWAAEAAAWAAFDPAGLLRKLVEASRA